MRWIVVPVVALGMLVVVPLGLGLLPVPAWLRWAWPMAGVLAVVALLLPAGWGAAALAGPYAAVTFALALTALPRVRLLAPVELAVSSALVTPAVAGAALVAERGGWALLGFGPKTLLLTVAHFHYAGFAAALIASLAARAAAGSRLAPLAALAVPAGTVLVLAGFFLGDVVGLLGASVLTAGMWLVAILTWRSARVPLRVAGAVSWVTMALGAAFGLPRLSLTWMAATHGVLNAVGFGVCGVLAYRRSNSPGGMVTTMWTRVGAGPSLR